MTTTRTDIFPPVGATLTVHLPEDAGYGYDGEVIAVYAAYDQTGTVVANDGEIITLETPEGGTAYVFADEPWDILDPFADVPVAEGPTVPDESDDYRDDDDRI